MPKLVYQAEEMANRSRTAQLFNFGKRIVSSDYSPRNHLQEFIRSTSGITLNIGSGNMRLRDDFINIDFIAMPKVDIQASGARLPFKSHSVDSVILDNLLEHVPEPQAVVDEVARVLKKGGRVIATVPWVFPYHGYPKNYFHMSEDGLRYLFRKFSHLEVHTHTGPSSGMTHLLSEYFAVGFGGDTFFRYTLLKGLFLLPIFWLKFFDWFWFRSEKAKRMASSLLITAVR